MKLKQLPWRDYARYVLYGLVVMLTVWLISSPAPSTQAQTTTFRNPLNSQRGADPWMRYYDGQYYLTASTYSSDPNVGITMKTGTTIAELKAATPQRIWQDSTASRCCNIWAPEFHLLDGPNGRRWYLYYVAGVSNNVDNQRMHVLESAGLDPMGPYTYMGQLNAGGPTDPWVTDPTVMTINGQLYLFYTAYEGVHFQSFQNIYGVALSNPWAVSGSPALISRPQFSWEMQTAAVNEAPVQLTAPDGTIYMVFSASWCGNPNYQLGRATYNGGPVLSQSSWVKHASPVFSQANGQSSTAHNGFFKSPDGTEDWIVYHGVDNTNGDCGPTLRTTRIQRFTWNADGTPNFGQPLALTTDIPVPSGEGGGPTPTPTATPPSGGTNLALDATPSTSYVSPWETLSAINDGFEPASSQDNSNGAYGNWPETGVQWVQYDFDQNYTIDRIAVYWWDDNLGIDLPTATNVQYWNGSSFVDVPNAVGNGTAPHQYNVTMFDPVATDAIRLEITSNGSNSTGILEFQVFGTGGGPTPTPTPTATPGGPGLEAWYQFDESSGSTASDSSGNGNSATLVNGPTWVAGQSGNAVNLDGSNDYVSMPTGIVSSLDDFTIATWVRLDTTGNWRRLFDFGTGTSVNMFLVPQSGSGTVRFAITTGGWSAEQQINGSSTLPTGQWTHVAVTRSGNTGTLYVNGAQVGQNNNLTLSPASLGNTNQNWIGRSQYSADAYLDGQVDDFRIYDRALSVAEVQTLFQNQ